MDGDSATTWFRSVILFVPPYRLDWLSITFCTLFCAGGHLFHYAPVRFVRSWLPRVVPMVRFAWRRGLIPTLPHPASSPPARDYTRATFTYHEWSVLPGIAPIPSHTWSPHFASHVASIYSISHAVPHLAGPIVITLVAHVVAACCDDLTTTAWSLRIPTALPLKHVVGVVTLLTLLRYRRYCCCYYIVILLLLLFTSHFIYYLHICTALHYDDITTVLQETNSIFMYLVPDVCLLVRSVAARGACGYCRCIL